MTLIARVAPDIFARTSIISALLVVVQEPCNISIIIPKKPEKINAKTIGLVIVKLLNCFLKNKNQNKVNTK